MEHNKTILIENEMRSSYLDYAMSVIVSRALPDVRDGLKPVHRRILYSMKESGYEYNKAYRKSARIVGDVMGKYHPHGDGPLYDSMVRMAQDFAMRMTLVDGQGNYGSMDGDPPAAMRYTEARMAKSAHFMLKDIEKETVDFKPNYDESTMEPKVLPTMIPNILVNGSSGIAVGMATNIPPHNLNEVVNAAIALLENSEITIAELMEHVKGPDFPTGAMIMGTTGIAKAYETGRGSVLMRAKTEIEESGKQKSIIIKEIPYQVNKTRLIEKIAEMCNEKIIEGVSDLRDESSERSGVRIVVELKRDAVAEVVLNQIYKHSPCQTSFGMNMLALVSGKPVLLNLKDFLVNFLNFREDIVIRRTNFDLKKSKIKSDMLLGLAIAVSNLDHVIEMIKTSKDPKEAKERLMDKGWPKDKIIDFLELIDSNDNEKNQYNLSEDQAKAILELKLHKLTGLEREKIFSDLKELKLQIKELLAILASKAKRIGIIKEELQEVSNLFGDKRRTEICEAELDTNDEDLIKKEDMVVMVSTRGYIKRTHPNNYKTQHRGGKGKMGMKTKDEDAINNIFVANTHDIILFFSNFGKVYSLKTYRLPLCSLQSVGKAMVNILPIEQKEIITAIMPMPDQSLWDTQSIFFATSEGNVRRNKLSDFVNIQSNGKIAIKLRDSEELISVLTCTLDHDIFLASCNGKSVRFKSGAIREFVGRNSKGIKGFKLSLSNDKVISMSLLNHMDIETDVKDQYLKNKFSDLKKTDKANLFIKMKESEQFILSITENGYGKRTSAYEYRITNRGGSGILNIDTSSRNGKVVSSFPVESDDEILLVTNQGRVIRCNVNNIRKSSRNTKGVIVFRVAKDEKVVSVTKIIKETTTVVPE